MLLVTNILLPVDEDLLYLANAISKIWHNNKKFEIALAEARKEMGNEEHTLNIFKRRVI